MPLHNADAGASLPDFAKLDADTNTELQGAGNNTDMSLSNSASQDKAFESHPPVITHRKKSRERKIAAQSQMSNRVSQTPAEFSVDGASDAQTPAPLEARRRPEILDDEQGEHSVKQEQPDKEMTSLQTGKKSNPAKKKTVKRCNDSDEEDIASELTSGIEENKAAEHGAEPEGNGDELKSKKNKSKGKAAKHDSDPEGNGDTPKTKKNKSKGKAAKHDSDSEGNGDTPKTKKRKTKVSALDALGISDISLTQSKTGKSKKTSASASVKAENGDDDDLDEDAEDLGAAQGSSARAKVTRRINNHGDAGRKTTLRIYSSKREPGHWPELCSLSQTKAKNIHQKLRDSGKTLLADVAEAICFPDEISGVKPHNGYVSKTYLKSIAPGEYSEKGFVRGSSLKKLAPWQVEESLGVPYLFFRATDENLALIGPDEDLEEVLKGKSPRMREVTAKRKAPQTSTASVQPSKKFKTENDQDDFSIAPEFGQSTPAMASAAERMTQEANRLELLHNEYDNVNISMQQSARSMQQSASNMQTIAAYAVKNTGRNLTDIEEYINFMDKNETHASLRMSNPEAGRVWQALTRGFKSLHHFSHAMGGSSAQGTTSEEQVAQSGLGMTVATSFELQHTSSVEQQAETVNEDSQSAMEANKDEGDNEDELVHVAADSDQGLGDARSDLEKC